MALKKLLNTRLSTFFVHDFIRILFCNYQVLGLGNFTAI